MSIISEFGEISGYKINPAKSLLFPINELAKLMSFEQYPFKVSCDNFTYLGVTVTRNYKDLFKYNFKPALDRAKLDLQRWCSLPLSLAGKYRSKLCKNVNCA